MDDISPADALAELTARAAQSSLTAAVHLLWPVLNPGEPLIWSPGLTAICLHCEAVTNGEIRRVLCNAPPGGGKSTITQRVWPVWEWVRFPEHRWMHATHSGSLSHDLNVARLDLIRSAMYQAALRPEWELAPGRQGVKQFANTRKGIMTATSTRARNILGKHYNRLNFDDLIDTTEAADIRVQEMVRHFIFQKALRRVRNPLEVAFWTTMQRLGVADPSAMILEWGVDAHICLPAEYDPSVDPGWTKIGWQDWRTEPGELLFPRRHTRQLLRETQYEMGSAGYAAQFQQNPSAADGRPFQAEWWQQHEGDEVRQDQWRSIVDRWVGAIDMASGKRSSSRPDRLDFTVAQVWAVIGDKAYLVDQIRTRSEYTQQRAQIHGLQMRWPECQHWLVEAKSIGPMMMSDLRAGGIRVSPWVSQDSKESRILSCSPLVEASQVSLPRNGQHAGWVGAFLQEAANWPAVAHDDQLDCMAIALGFLVHDLRAARKRIMRAHAAMSPGQGAKPSPPPGGVNMSPWR